jgi:hypothetical protein
MADEILHPNEEEIPRISTEPRQRCDHAGSDKDIPVQNMLMLMG